MERVVPEADRTSVDGQPQPAAARAAAYETPTLVELGDAARLTRYYSSGAHNDGSSDHPRVWWN